MSGSLPILDYLRSSPESEGLYDLEGDGGHVWRWSDGPETTLHFPAGEGQSLKAKLYSPVTGLRITLSANGQTLDEFTVESGGSGFETLVNLPASATSCTFRYSKWNAAGTDIPSDPRALAVSFSVLKIAPRRFFETKVCPYPFSQMDIPPYGPFIPCCYTWLTEEYYDSEPREFYETTHGRHDAWNGPCAVGLRDKILQGDYSWCRREICNARLYTLEELAQYAERPEHHVPPVSPGNIAAMARGEHVLPDGPAYASITGDPRCNLACPSCRKEKIVKLDAYGEELLGRLDATLKKHAATIQIMKLAGDGEVFFSPYLRDLLQSAGDRSRFPALRQIDLITNGLLCTPEAWERLRPGTDLIKRISVSIDAGTAEVYRTVRGGDWDRLVKNLEWMGEMRRQGKIEDLTLRFVVRKENFRTIPDFVKLAERVGADSVDLSQFVEWRTSGLSFRDEAVHLPSHPLHKELLEITHKARDGAKVGVYANF